VHKLRARVDAILIGSQTVARDDPRLTARDVPIRRRALRVVLDSRLGISEKCRLVDTAQELPTLVMTSPSGARSAKASGLTRKGVEVIPCRTRGNHLALDACLAKLAGRGVTNLLVEGGSTIITAFFEARLVDEALVFTAPILIGGEDAPSVLSGRGANSVNKATTPRAIQIGRSGVDTVHHLRFSDPTTLT
jgi:diaminohydroxyphosphoribosylaminopyrimidine deaminase/5-amino-6-(5-phosphoribosylamino)uracil reductase